MADRKNKMLPGTEECSETTEKAMESHFHSPFSSLGIFCYSTLFYDRRMCRCVRGEMEGRRTRTVEEAVRDGGMEAIYVSDL